MISTRSFTPRTYHFVGEFGETVIRIRSEGTVWFFRPNREPSFLTRSQAAAVILALDATQERGTDWRA